MKVKALTSFVGRISMNIDDEREIIDKELAKDLIRAGYVVKIKEIEETIEEVETTEAPVETTEEVETTEAPVEETNENIEADLENNQKETTEEIEETTEEVETIEEVEETTEEVETPTNKNKRNKK